MMQNGKQTSKEAEQEIEVPKYSTIKKILQIIFISSLLFFLNVGSKSPLISSSSTNKSVIVQSEIDLVGYPILVKQRIHTQLVNEVNVYMKSMAPDTKINSEHMVTLCQKYNLDITFVLAQALLESHFGTKGKSLTTNSVFNVGSFDNGKVLYTYKSVNESLEPYMQLVTENYLVNNRSIADLIQDRGYKNKNGYRFATSALYEQRLRTLMVNINMQTSIKMYQEIMNLPDEKILAYFGPVTEENSAGNYTSQK